MRRARLMGWGILAFVAGFECVTGGGVDARYGVVHASGRITTRAREPARDAARDAARAGGQPPPWRRPVATATPSLAACAGAASARRAADARPARPAATRGRSSTTSARPAAASGRRPMAARPGRRSPTRRSRRSSVGAVAVAPSNPDVVYVGMGESQLRGNIIQGDGVYKTTDARQDLDAHGAREDHGRVADPRASDQSRHRLRGGARQSLCVRTPDRGVFRSQRRRQDLGARAVPRREDRRGRSGDRSEESRRPLCRAVGGVPHAAFAVERRAGQRTVQVDRRRRRPGPRSRASRGCRRRVWSARSA